VGVSPTELERTLAEKLEATIRSPFTWFVQAYMFDPEFAVIYPTALSGYPRFGDVLNVMYDNNGDIIHGVFDGVTNKASWPSFVEKIKRPKSGIIGGDVEWKWVPPDGGVGSPTSIYHSRALNQTLVMYKGKIYILDGGGNLVKTVTPATTINRWLNRQPNMIFYNDKQILVADWNVRRLYIVNIADGSIAWSLSLSPPTGAGWGPITVWREISNSDTCLIFFCYENNYVQYISFSVSDEYTLPPTSPTVMTAYYAPHPSALASWRGGKKVLLDCIDGEYSFGYLHINPDDNPPMCIPFLNSNSVDIHPSLPRAVFTHVYSIFELDISRAVNEPPFRNNFANLYVGQPPTSETLLAWTYTKMLTKVVFHIYNSMDVSATVNLYYMYPYSTTGKVRGTLLNTLTPPPTPSITQTVSAGASIDIALTSPPMAVLVSGLSATSPTSGNLIVSVYGEV
jgi:hypothetical protein